MSKKFVVLIALLVLLASCAANGPHETKPASPRVNTVYIWDADGHIDLALLRGLKAEAGSYMKSKGIAVSDNPEATESYLKITVIDATKDEDSGHAYINARLYILNASDSSIIYDRTFEAKGKGDYPIGKFVEGALKDYFR